MKFGGTSVGTPQSMKNLVDIVEQRNEPLLVVVSAFGGVTDLLIKCATLASQGSCEYMPHLNIIIGRHREMIAKMVKYSKTDIEAKVEEMLKQLSDIFRGISLLKEVSERSMDIIVSFGERMSSLIVSGAIEGATFMDSLDVVKTEKWYDRNIANSDLTQNSFRNLKGKLKAKAPLIMGGFISKDKDSGDITNLGRGGSDYTAALAAAALDAETLEIWTDVDGFMTADPRIIPTAKVMERMSFIDSIELCNFGAKVVYPPTIYPVFHKNIPIRVLNTFNPTAPGTLICEAEAIQYHRPTIVGVSALRTASLIRIKLSADLPSRDDFASRALGILSKKGVPVVLVDSRCNLKDVAFVINRVDLDLALKSLEEEFAPERAIESLLIEKQENIAVVALVGEKINEMTALEDTVSLIALRHGINLLAAPAAPTPTTYTLAVPTSEADTMLKLLHAVYIEKC